RADDLQRRTDRLGIVLAQAADERVGVAHRDHHRAEAGRPRDARARFHQREALALALLPEVLRVALAVLAGAGLLDVDRVQRDAELLGGRAHAILAAQEDRDCDAVVGEDLRGADDFRILALGEDHALGLTLRARRETAHDAAGTAE